jgi:hypothetical protein
VLSDWDVVVVIFLFQEYAWNSSRGPIMQS